jgi:hypothetical protein
VDFDCDVELLCLYLIVIECSEKSSERPHLEQSRSKCDVELRQRSGLVLS